jgi:hypothetical protein
VSDWAIVYHALERSDGEGLREMADAVLADLKTAGRLS